MAIDTNVVSVGTAPTILAVGGGGTDGRKGQTTCTVKPAASGSAEVYVGKANVTAANGLPLGGGISFDLSGGETLYGIVASGTVAVRVLEHGI